MKSLSLILSSKSLAIYKSFFRSNLDYSNLTNHKPLNESLKRKFETAQYKDALVITDAIKETSRDRCYYEVGLESLTDSKWSWRFFFFHKIIQGI